MEGSDKKISSKKTKSTSQRSVVTSTTSTVKEKSDTKITSCEITVVTTDKITSNGISKKLLTTDMLPQLESACPDITAEENVAATETKVSKKKNVTATTSSTADSVTTGKKKVKKTKRSDSDKGNISVKSSFSKFDALQKKNLIHVRSSDAGKAQKKFSNPNVEKETKCRVCLKPVYKMEEIKTEKNIFHKNCFRCKECDKQLNVDTYQSHEGYLYCKAHFKLLFAPKVVEDLAPEKPRKPELIIRENQPDELPPDVVRASNKPDLGLEELQELNVRSKFQVFESGFEQQPKQPQSAPTGGVKRSQSILSKLAKLQAKGFIAGVSAEDFNGISAENGKNAAKKACVSKSKNDSDSESDSTDSDVDEDDVDPDLVRSKKRTQREHAVGLGPAMNDIKVKFENGHLMSKEEKREERKQEIQNIRSRLFMGKQARLKEMYQQAVADSEQSVTSAGKNHEIDVGEKASSLREKFEKGEIFREHEVDGDDNNGGRIDDSDVFESAISKTSRSLFMELDASAAAGIAQQQKLPGLQRNRSIIIDNDQTKSSNPSSATTIQKQHSVENVVKHDEKTDDIKIETSEISSKFKFFETYRPSENQKKQFRITPPREGVVKLPTPESDEETDGAQTNALSSAGTDTAEKTHTTTIMLSKFRELEQLKNSRSNDNCGPRPLKCFTPPPNDNRRVYQDQDSDVGSEDDDNDDYEYDDDDVEEEDDEDQNYRSSAAHLDDEVLREAQAAARAKQLRAKFEKWEANEIQREINEGSKFIYSEQCADDSTIESTKSIRERFENMKENKNSPSSPRYKVNRFV